MSRTSDSKYFLGRTSPLPLISLNFTASSEADPCTFHLVCVWEDAQLECAVIGMACLGISPDARKVIAFHATLDTVGAILSTQLPRYCSPNLPKKYLRRIRVRKIR